MWLVFVDLFVVLLLWVVNYPWDIVFCVLWVLGFVVVVFVLLDVG